MNNLENSATEQKQETEIINSYLRSLAVLDEIIKAGELLGGKEKEG